MKRRAERKKEKGGDAEREGRKARDSRKRDEKISNP